MNQVLEKADQYNTTKFHGKLVVNKPVMHDINSEVDPYSNLYYWSHSLAFDDCEFELHPHKGFEIITFIFEGQVTHFDTASNVWTPLHKDDFQIIQTGSGIQHAEKISNGTRSFQIWFDPNFNEAIKNKPAYKYYHGSDFEAIQENDIEIIDYVGGKSDVKLATDGVFIKKIKAQDISNYDFDLDPDSQYAFYVLSGNMIVNGLPVLENDVVKVSRETNADITFNGAGEIFIIQIPLKLAYKVIWEL